MRSQLISISDVKSKSHSLRRTDVILRLGKDDQINLNVSVSPVHPSFGQKIGEGYVVTLAVTLLKKRV